MGAGAAMLLAAFEAAADSVAATTASGSEWAWLCMLRNMVGRWGWIVRAPLLLGLQALMLRQALLADPVRVMCSLPAGERAAGRRVQMWERRISHLCPEDLLAQRAAIQAQVNVPCPANSCFHPATPLRHVPLTLFVSCVVAQTWLGSTFVLGLPPRLAAGCIFAATISSQLYDKMMHC